MFLQPESVCPQQLAESVSGLEFMAAIGANQQMFFKLERILRAKGVKLIER
jgi:hypothetical protein